MKLIALIAAMIFLLPRVLVAEAEEVVNTSKNLAMADVLAIADQEARRRVYDIEHIEHVDVHWQENMPWPDFETELKGREYVAVSYSRLNKDYGLVTGWSLWVFVDRSTGEIIRIQQLFY